MFIEVKNVTKKYGKNDNEFYALNNASLEIEQKEIAVILGPSGSGKSTLMNIIGGLDKVDSGEVSVNGRRIDNMSDKQLLQYRKDDLGFIFQSYNLVPDITAYENIKLICDVAEDTIPAEELIEKLGLKQFRDHFPKELSGGQQQRVAIARAMVKKPKLLLCDELTAALDTASSKEALCLVQEMNETYGTTTIIVTHNENITAMADRIIRLRDGRIVSNTKNDNKISASELEL